MHVNTRKRPRHHILCEDGWNGWTYKTRQFHLKRRGSPARRRRARPRGRRSPRRDSETLLRHTRWLLNEMRRRWREKQKTMQHEMTEVDVPMSS